MNIDLTFLRDSTEQDWEMAIDTAERRTDCQRDYDAAMAAWDAAEEALDAGDTGAALEHLETARALARSWGQDSYEQQAIEAVRDAADPNMVTIEEMPDQHVASHRAAGNWGRYPANGATRSRVSREEAERIMADDEDGYAHIVEE